MKTDVRFLAELISSFLPFVLFAFLNAKANVKKEKRCRQYPMPVVALLYSIVLMVFMNRLATLCTEGVLSLANLIDRINLSVDLPVNLAAVSAFIRKIYSAWGIYLALTLFNNAALVLYVTLKRILTAVFSKIKVDRNSFIGSAVELFYTYDERDGCWYIKEHFGQARSFIKTVYCGVCILSGIVMLVSCSLCMNHLVSAPFYPVFAVIVIGEMAFFLDGVEAGERKSELAVHADNAKHIAMYPLLRKPLKALFGDKLSAEGTTINNGSISGGAVEDVLIELEKNGGHIGVNYAAFIRRKMDAGLKPNLDYLRCGYDLAAGRSLLFNTPFYDKLNPYVFYAMNRELLTGGKTLIILGRHGTEEDLRRWTESGMTGVSNIPGLWKISVLSGAKLNEDDLPDIGIISRSGVHDLDIHKSNLPFLRKVSFVVVIEPSELVATAQIGLNLLVKCCGKDRAMTFCSVDRNCDGLVDALSHILMTDITEVSATEYPHGMSSYMFWTADDDYLQHRVLPGVSRYLGMGTELSMVALKNQVRKTVWYGGEAFPVRDVHWIAKQYYYDLLRYAELPQNQETFDKYFRTSYNMSDERVSDYSFITVEDDRNNLFETRRNFATIAEQQGFVNVISSEYMLREYMAANTEVFTADAKAIPYITADYARTKRNAILSVCLLLCIDSVQEDFLYRQMAMLHVDTEDPAAEIWKEVCVIFGSEATEDEQGDPILSVKNGAGKTVCFTKDSTILYKREYSVESGRYESVYTIENADFSRMILDDLQNASYIAEQESKDVYIGTELKGHVYQKYMPGQFFTLNGKYYEMVSTTSDNRILVRRASEHIDGRLAYRQIRNYTMHHLEDSPSMGALKTVNNIDMHYQFADFSVETPGYWKLHAYNDFDNGDLVKVNGVPTRRYYHKQVLKFDFSKFGDAFTDAVRMTLTNLLNEAFLTLFADNQPFISAVTPGSYDAPLTYSLALDADIETSDKCIYIIEDSQLDIGLQVAVERNVKRIFQIISDYLAWNEEQIAESIRKQHEPAKESKAAPFHVYEDEEKNKKGGKGLFCRIAAWFKGVFGKIRRKPGKGAEKNSPASEGELTPKQKKKAERAAAKVAAKAEKQAAREKKQALKHEKKLQKQQAKFSKKTNEEDVPCKEEPAEPPATNPFEDPSEATEEKTAQPESEVEVSDDE